MLQVVRAGAGQRIVTPRGEEEDDHVACGGRFRGAGVDVSPIGGVRRHLRAVIRPQHVHVESKRAVSMKQGAARGSHAPQCLIREGEHQQNRK